MFVVIMCDFNETNVCDIQSICIGRRFARKFDKKYYPLLGDDDTEKEIIHLRGISSIRSGSQIFHSKHGRNSKHCLSTTVTKIQDLCRDPKTGRWRWPSNGADLVYPGIYLGDE